MAGPTLTPDDTMKRFLPSQKPLPSYWLKDISFPPPPDRLPKAVYDVVVVGAGISGASVAWHMRHLNPASRVALIDARGIASGATGRNGGLIVPGLNYKWTALTERLGIAKAKQLLRFENANCDELRKFSERFAQTAAASNGTQAQDPHFHEFTEGCVQMLNTPEEIPFWQGEIEQMKREGGCEVAMDVISSADAEALTGNKDQVGAVHKTPGYRMWPAKFVWSLVQEALRMDEQGGNLDVFTHTMVEGVKSDEGLVEITTQRGILSARHVVYCTNAYTRGLLPTLPIAPVRNQVVVTNPIEPVPFDLAADAHDGYEYLSTRESGRVILGGMRYLAPDHDIGNNDEESLNPDVSAGLRSYLPAHFSGLKDAKVEMEWPGMMGFSRDGFPFVGPLGPSRPGEYVCAGFGGHGMPRTFLCGRNVARMVLGLEVEPDCPDWFGVSGRKLLGEEEAVEVADYGAQL
ncbi:FAD dependent oxidoreductase [Phlyctochytrium arcticum]|nr:FAD dependent oxidoreductase [Phlyctochytrium arcticum]